LKDRVRPMSSMTATLGLARLLLTQGNR
jgi:hypothetical protein